MAFEVLLTMNAQADYLALDARSRAMVKEAMKTHLRHEPRKESKSRIKRLRGMEYPEYRLRVNDLRVFYQVEEDRIEVLAIVFKHDAQRWLEQFGVRADDESSTQ